PEIGLQRAGVVAGVRERETARMPQHMGVDLQLETGGLRCTLHHPGKPGCREWRAPLADEHELAGLALALQPAKRAQLRSAQWVHAGCALLGPTDVQDGAIEVDLVPT